MLASLVGRPIHRGTGDLRTSWRRRRRRREADGCSRMIWKEDERPTIRNMLHKEMGQLRKTVCRVHPFQAQGMSATIAEINLGYPLLSQL